MLKTCFDQPPTPHGCLTLKCLAKGLSLCVTGLSTHNDKEAISGGGEDVMGTKITDWISKYNFPLELISSKPRGCFIKEI